MTARPYTEDQRTRQIASEALKLHEQSQLAIWITHEGWHCDDPDDFFRWAHLKEALGEDVPRVWEPDTEPVTP